MKTHTVYRLAEIALWVVGAAILSLVAYTLVDDEVERRQALDLFSQARAEMVAVTAEQEVVPDTLTADGAGDLLPGDRSGAAGPGSPEAATVATSAENLPIAVLRIDSVGLEVPVFANTSEDNLSRGAGWVSGTARPNDGGNMGIAAHRDRYFRPLKDVKVGEHLDLLSLDGEQRYRVTEVMIVDPEDTWVLDRGNADAVTLVTCYPFYFVGNAPRRYIVRAELDS